MLNPECSTNPYMLKHQTLNAQPVAKPDRWAWRVWVTAKSSSSSLLLASLELSDTKVYEPQIRARLGTTAHYQTLNAQPVEKPDRWAWRVWVTAKYPNPKPV